MYCMYRYFSQYQKQVSLRSLNNNRGVSKSTNYIGTYCTFDVGICHKSLLITICSTGESYLHSPRSLVYLLFCFLQPLGPNTGGLQKKKVLGKVLVTWIWSFGGWFGFSSSNPADPCSVRAFFHFRHRLPVCSQFRRMTGRFANHTGVVPANLKTIVYTPLANRLEHAAAPLVLAKLRVHSHCQ